MESYKKQINGYIIIWSIKEKRYIIKKDRRRIYDTETINDAISWIERNG